MKTCYDFVMAKGRLAEWLEGKYLDWQKENGRDSVVEFAKYLNMSNEYLYQLMNGHREGISKKLALQIAQCLRDFEIMDILGYARPDPEDLLSNFPPDVRDPILAALSEARSELVKRGIETDSPEAMRILSTAFAKFGVNFTFTKK